MGTTHPFTPYASFHESFAYKPLTDLATKVFATVETIPPRATPSPASSVFLVFFLVISALLFFPSPMTIRQWSLRAPPTTPLGRFLAAQPTGAGPDTDLPR